MIKTNLFLDFDSTLCDSATAACLTYDHLYYKHPGFKMANPKELTQWDMKDVCPLLGDVNELFDNEYFFRVLQTFPHAVDTIKKLQYNYNIIICSIGTYRNISLKSKWIRQNLHFIDNAILIHNGNCKMDKSIVNMSDGIILDDHMGNLKSSDAKVKICFGKEFDWNRGWDGFWCKDWYDVENMLV